MKLKNCDLTLTTPALLKSLLVAYAGSLVRRRKGGGGGGGGFVPPKKGGVFF